MDNMHEWVAYSDLCRKASVQTNNTLGDQRCKDVLEMLLGLKIVRIVVVDDVLVEMKPEPKKLVELIPHKHPKLIYSYVKYLWYSNQRTFCLSTLVQLIDHLGSMQSYYLTDVTHLQLQYPRRLIPRMLTIKSYLHGLYARHPSRRADPPIRCYFKLGEWQSSSIVEAGHATRNLSEENITQILDVYQCATITDRLWDRVRHFFFHPLSSP
jgi:hypothetical protein